MADITSDLEDTHGLTEQEQIIQLNKVIYAQASNLSYIQALVSTLEHKVSTLESQMNNVVSLELPVLKTTVNNNHTFVETALNYARDDIKSMDLDIGRLDVSMNTAKADMDLLKSRMYEAERDIDGQEVDLSEIKCIIREIQDSLFDSPNYKAINFK